MYYKLRNYYKLQRNNPFPSFRIQFPLIILVIHEYFQMKFGT